MPKGKTVHMNNKTLVLTLKKEWFNKILSGEKTEEYRELKPYWFKRLVFMPEKVVRYMLNKEIKEMTQKDLDKLVAKKVGRDFVAFKPFTHIEFRNGYSKTSRRMKVELKDIFFGPGITEHGAEKGKEYFVLCLGKVIETKYC